jgi:hypothetical protein
LIIQNLFFFLSNFSIECVIRKPDVDHLWWVTLFQRNVSVFGIFESSRSSHVDFEGSRLRVSFNSRIRSDSGEKYVIFDRHDFSMALRNRRSSFSRSSSIDDDEDMEADLYVEQCASSS